MSKIFVLISPSASANLNCLALTRAFRATTNSLKLNSNSAHLTANLKQLFSVLVILVASSVLSVHSGA